MPDTDYQQLQEFNLPGSLDIRPSEGNLPSVTVKTDPCIATQYLHGAHVTHWQPADHEPVLFTSAEAVYRDGKAIRGGVPICFPWFNAHPTDPDAPAHGLVRASTWQLTQTAQGPAGVETQMVTNLPTLHANYRATFGKQLTLNLTVTNTSDTDQTFEAALHTYLAVGDVKQVFIAGLENADYIDQLQDNKLCTQDDQPLTFTAETDRIYVDNQATCTLTDPTLNRQITIEKLGSLSTVVWNPWVDKSARTADFGDDEWTGMCCIESANIGDDAVRLAPGESHTLLVRVSVTPI
ncbi:MAG: D-hexose-6-phosphate mutarotase [Planctomycetota bacterium]